MNSEEVLGNIATASNRYADFLHDFAILTHVKSLHREHEVSAALYSESQAALKEMLYMNTTSSVIAETIK